jgi:hypothetical protein
MRINAAKLANPIQVGGLEKGLANQWDGKRITKKARACPGHETIWEIPNQNRKL